MKRELIVYRRTDKTAYMQIGSIALVGSARERDLAVKLIGQAIRLLNVSCPSYYNFNIVESSSHKETT